MADTTLLLTLLREYRDSLRSHVADLRNDFDHLESTWHNFGQVYEGTAAKQFKAGWGRTEANFEEYIEQTTRILAALNERLERLADADRTEDIL